MSQAPEKIFRIGSVSASVFARTFQRPDEQGRVIRSVCLQKRYLDDGEAKFSSSFGLSELPQALEVLRNALQYVMCHEGDLLADEHSREDR